MQVFLPFFFVLSIFLCNFAAKYHSNNKDGITELCKYNKGKQLQNRM